MVSAKEMEDRLVALGQRWTAQVDGVPMKGVVAHTDTAARDEYRRLYPVWLAAKDQGKFEC